MTDSKDKKMEQTNQDGATGFQTVVQGGTANIGIHYHSSASSKSEVVDVKPYLKFVCQDSRYQDIRDLYTETEALIPLEAETVERKSDDLETDLGRSPRPVERFPVIEGLQKYALGRERQHVLLAGRPGSGKSTTLKRLLLELADAGLADSTVIPVYVQLKSDRSISDLILAEFRRAKVRVTSDQLDDWLMRDQLVLLLDGVNEIPSDTRRIQIQEFRDQNPTTPMIFTTRDLSLGGNLGVDKRLEMRPLSEPQMREFIGKYLAKRGMPDQVDTLIRQLRDRLREIAETPLLLKILCDVFDPITQQIPQSKGELFQQFDRDYERIKKDTEYVPVSENFWEFKADTLQYLAFSMIQTDDPKSVEAWYSLSRDRAEKLLETWLKHRGVTDPATKAKLWLKDLLRCHLLQEAKDPGDIEFHHQLFQEYYAAEYLRQRLPDLLKDENAFKRDYLNLLKWTEPIALMLALVEQEALALRVAKLALEVDIRLGARLAGEATLDLQSATVGEITELSVANWLKIELLGQTQSKVASPKLLAFLKHSNIDLVEMAASYIGETDDQEAINILKSRLEEISTTFFSQRVYGGNDKTSVLWTTHVQALSHLSPSEATKYLREELKKHGSLLLMTTQAAQILMQLDAGKFIPGLLEDFRSAQDKENEKMAASWEEAEETLQMPDLTELGIDKNAFEALRSTRLSPPSPEFLRRNHVLNLLGSSTDYELFVPALVQLFEQEPDETIQRQIIQILGKSNHDSAIDLLIQILGGDSDKLRSKAVEQLIKLKSVDDLRNSNELVKLIKHKDWYTSWCSAFVLGHLRDSVVLSRMMCELENNQRSEVRSTAAKILGIISDPSCIPSLVKAIDQNSDRYVRLNIACALSHFGQKEAIPLLLDSLKSRTNADPHAEIMKGIARFDLKEPLYKVIETEDLYWQRATIELGKIIEPGTEDASIILPKLFDALVEPGHESANEIIDLLPELADSEMINCLIDALNCPEKYTRDIYFSNRVALVLVRCQPEMMADKLSDLKHLYEDKYIQQLSWLIPTIQDRCKFYNYEIWQESIENLGSENQKKEQASVAKQTTHVFPNVTDVRIFERVDRYYENPPSTQEPPS